MSHIAVIKGRTFIRLKFEIVHETYAIERKVEHKSNTTIGSLGFGFFLRHKFLILENCCRPQCC